MTIRTKIRLLLCLQFFLIELPCLTVALIAICPCQNSIYKSRRIYGHRVTFLFSGLTTDGNTQQVLKSMTVKELRHIVKESSFNRRGILSQLKRKQDLVEFLDSNLEATEWEAIMNDKSELASKTVQTTSPKEIVGSGASKDLPTEELKLTGQRPISMPSKPVAVSTSPAQASPKDVIFEKVYRRYPPLKDQECMEIGANDVRQLYHPILRDSNSTDMDIVFVGTASCSPGMTRGVSCTALRLNGYTQRSLDGVPQQGAFESSTFSGGTWLFDCGECTQLMRSR
eukprot:scaffold24603_cov186-Cylindrotheca_fusiformis.AAC.2